MVDEDSAHDPCCHGEKMSAILPSDLLGIDEANVGLIDQRRGLEAMTDPLAGHAATRDTVEFSLNKRDQSRESLVAPLSPRLEERRHVVWRRHPA